MTDQQILEYWRRHVKNRLRVARLIRIMAEETPAAHKRTLTKVPKVNQLLKELNND